MADNTKIWATYTDSFDIGCRVIKWDEKNGLDFHPNGKFTKRNLPLNELQKNIHQFTVHWSVTYRAKHMYNGLNYRGLSCNFMIDDNENEKGFADIYQLLPIMHAGWSQGAGCNTLGPGVEISYMPQAWENPGLYSDYNQKKWDVPPHETTTGLVHGSKLKVFLPTKAQIASLKCLIWGFSELFPDVPVEFPKDSNGNYITTVLPDPKVYVGLANHYNLKRSKIDTAGLDLANIEEDVRAMKKWGF